MKNAFAILPLVLCGCMSLPSIGPDYREALFEINDITLPDAGMPTTNLTSTGEYKVASGDDDCRVEITTNQVVSWWNRFNDDKLTNLVAEAIGSNLSYRMAIERLEASRWNLFGAYAAFMPKVEAGARAAFYQYGSRKFPKEYHFGFDASWEIDVFGGSRREAEASMADFAASGYALSDAWVSLTAEVGRRYIELRTTQQRIAVARRNLVLQSETYDILKSRLDSGIGDDLAVSQSKYTVDQTRASIPDLLAKEESIKNAIAILAGKMPGELHKILSDCPDRDWLIAPRKLSSAPLNMLRARPDVRRAERELAASVARIGVAKSYWYPKFFINGSIGLKEAKFSKLFDKESFFASLGPSISWPIFQGGAVYAGIKVQEAYMREKALSYEYAIQKAYAEIRDTYSNYTQEYHRYQALQGAVKAAKDAVSISRDLYKNGLRDFTAVIDAQRSLLDLEEQLVISRGQITQNAIDLFKALGGGIE
jgi:NodT family efflux transporter outer membrane factor (OMF) lipoprotein